PPDAEIARYRVGASPDRAHEPQEDRHRRNERDDPHGGHHQRDLIAIAAEGNDEVAWPFGQPGKAETEHEDGDQEKKDADHRHPPALLRRISTLRKAPV